MRRPAHLALTLILLAACGDDGNNSNGDGGDGDGGNGDGGGECVIDPLPACAKPVAGTNVVLSRVGDFTFEDAGLLVTAPPEDPRLFVVIHDGTIRIVKDDAIVEGPAFFSVNDPGFTTGTNRDERGLLGLAFHPKYKCNGQFFIFYTAISNQMQRNVVARCSVSADDPNIAEEACTPILTIPDFASNHNGGMMEFGSDGYLYIGTGDGGNAGDPRRTAQALNDADTTNNGSALLGKILRIDVDSRAEGKEYGIPPSNPFAAGGGAPEIWMYGVRNPWRWSFDKGTGDLWIGDVGQDRWEELNAIRAGEQSGRNLGWSVWEGKACCTQTGAGELESDGCARGLTGAACPAKPANLFEPQRVYRHDSNGEIWESIIAGTTYRGSCFPDLVGWHFYTDLSSISSKLHRARLLDNGQLQTFDYSTPPDNWQDMITSMHHDARGEIYVTAGLGAGRLYRLVAL